MALAIEITDGRGLSNEARRELLLIAIFNLYSFPYLCFTSLKDRCSRYYYKAFRMEHLPSNCNL